MSIGKSILVWIMTGLIAIAAFFCNIFGLEPPTMPDCLTEPISIVTTTTTTTTSTAAPQTLEILLDRGDLIALGTTLDATVVDATFITANSQVPPTMTTRVVTGIPLLALLADEGIAASQVISIQFFAADAPASPTTFGGASVNSLALVLHANTLIGWLEGANGATPTPPTAGSNTAFHTGLRLYPGGSNLAGFYTNNLTKIVVNY